jgi:hypothetical protein
MNIDEIINCLVDYKAVSEDGIKVTSITVLSERLLIYFEIDNEKWVAQVSKRSY